MNIRIQNAVLKKNKITYADCEATKNRIDPHHYEFSLNITNRDLERKRFTLREGTIVEDESGRYTITEVWYEPSPKFIHLIAQPTKSFVESYSDSTKDILNQATTMSTNEIEDTIKALASYLSLRAKAV